MKVITLPEIVSQLRCRRNGRTFIGEFINQCKSEDAIIILEGATNGDIIMTMFPNAEVNVTKYSHVVEVKLPYHTKHDTGLLFDKGFWYAPFKKGVGK